MLTHPPLQKAVFALSPRLKALWVNSSLPPGSFRIFQKKVIFRVLKHQLLFSFFYAD